jgi:hypothetical protein
MELARNNVWVWTGVWTVVERQVTIRLPTVMIAVAMPNGLCGQPGQDPSAAFTAARSRQNLIKTIKIEFKRIDTEAAGSRSGSVPTLFKPKTAVPDRETTSESNNRFVMDGDKMRFEDNHPIWRMPAGTLHNTAMIAVSDGTLAKTLKPKGVVGAGTTTGTIREAVDRLDLSDPVLTPIILHFRGAHSEISPYPIATMKATGIRLPIDNQDCTEYALILGELNLSFWFDPARDYCLRRLAQHKTNTLLYQLDVKYRRDDKWGWLPVSWVAHDYGTARELLKTTKVEVLEMRPGEVESPDTFELLFPAETRVFDARNNKEYRVQSNESMREISSSGKELGGSVAQLEGSYFYRHKWLLLGITMLVIAAIVLLAIRKKIGGRPHRPS